MTMLNSSSACTCTKATMHPIKANSTTIEGMMMFAFI